MIYTIQKRKREVWESGKVRGWVGEGERGGGPKALVVRD
jgi:hypothetical protein